MVVSPLLRKVESRTTPTYQQRRPNYRFASDAGINPRAVSAKATYGLLEAEKATYSILVSDKTSCSFWVYEKAT